MIRLGSLAGYPFEGPRVLAGWTPPATAAVYAIAYKPEPDTKPDKYAVIYVGHSDDLSAERFPFQHPRAHCWIKRAGSKWKVYICTFEVPGGGRAHREQIARELTAIYQPRCNDQQYDQAWKDEWIGGTTSSSPSLAKDPARPGSRDPAGLGSPRLARRAEPTASSRRERRVPEAGRAGSGTAGGSGRGVTPVTMPSAIPYSSGSAPATTPPVSLMCSTPAR